MKYSESIAIIYRVACSKMKPGKASIYVGEVITFCISRLSEHGKFSTEELEKELAEEAEFHLRCEKQNVA